MITRDNYEEFFLLYTDNELSEPERREVEQFVTDNPDLREEWETLLQCRISPDTRLAFPERDSLLKPEIEGSAYTGALLSYIDGELSPEERARIEAVILEQPRVAIELGVLRQTISQPDASVVFPDKVLLYQPERNRRVVVLPWLRVGIAAAVAGAIALAFLLQTKQQTPPPNTNATIGTSPNNTASAGTTHPNTASTGTSSTNGALAKNDTPVYNPESPTTHKIVPAVTPAPLATLHSMEGQSKTQKDRSAPQLIHRQQPQQQYIALNANRDAQKQNRDAVSANRDAQKQNRDAVASADGKADPVGTMKGIDAVRDTDPFTTNTTASNKPITTDDIGSMSPKTGRTYVVSTVQTGIPKEQSSFATQALQEEANDERNNSFVAEETASQSRPALRGIFRKLKRALGKTADRDGDGNRQVTVGAFQVSID